MRHLRFTLILLLAYLGFFLNIERLDIGDQSNVVNLASFVYILAGVAVISTILIPNRWKLSTRTITLFWVAFYLLFKIVVFNSRPVIGGQYTYISIAELVFVALSVILTRNFLTNLQDLEDIVANITLADVSNRVMNLDSAFYDINKEFARSRRYSRQLGVVVIKLKPENIQVNKAHLSKDILNTMMSRYSMSSLIRSIDNKLRRPDLILEHHKENRIILLLPETNNEAAQAVIRNLQEIAKDKVGLQNSMGFAIFPNDALTFDDLVGRAESMIDQTEKESKFESQIITERANQEMSHTDQAD